MRVQTLLALAGELYNINHPDQAIQQCEKARQLSTTINYTDGLSKRSRLACFLYEQQGDKKLWIITSKVSHFSKNQDPKGRGNSIE